MAVKRISSFLSLWLPVFAHLVLIYYLSSQPDLPQPEIEIPFLDKIEHLLAFGLMGFLLYRAFYFSFGEFHPLSLLVTILVVLYGISDEIHQSFVPTRTPDVMDVVFDGLGGLLATQISFVKRLARRPFLVNFK